MFAMKNMFGKAWWTRLLTAGSALALSVTLVACGGGEASTSASADAQAETTAEQKADSAKIQN